MRYIPWARPKAHAYFFLRGGDRPIIAERPTFLSDTSTITQLNMKHRRSPTLSQIKHLIQHILKNFNEALLWIFANSVVGGVQPKARDALGLEGHLPLTPLLRYEIAKYVVMNINSLSYFRNLSE